MGIFGVPDWLRTPAPPPQQEGRQGPRGRALEVTPPFSLTSPRRITPNKTALRHILSIPHLPSPFAPRPRRYHGDHASALPAPPPLRRRRPRSGPGPAMAAAAAAARERRREQLRRWEEAAAAAPGPGPAEAPARPPRVRFERQAEFRAACAGAELAEARAMVMAPEGGGRALLGGANADGISALHQVGGASLRGRGLTEKGRGPS